jgi:hypothetical protein
VDAPDVIQDTGNPGLVAHGLALRQALLVIRQRLAVVALRLVDDPNVAQD